MTKFLKGFTIEVDKIPKYSEFNGKFTEHIDDKLCDMIVKEKYNDFVIKHHATENEISPTMTRVKDLQSNIKNNKNIINFSQTSVQIGRYYGDTFCALPKKIKHTLFKYSKMVDIDQHKGHPRIAVGLGALNGFRFTNMEEYVNNDLRIFDEMAEWYGIDIKNKTNGSQNKNRLKWFFNLTIYGGGYDNKTGWLNGLTNPSEKDVAEGYLPLELKTKEMMPFMKAFKQDCQKLIINVWERNKDIQDVLAKQEGYDKLQLHEKQNRCISYFMQIIENDALYHAYKYLKKNGFITRNDVSLESDGLCFPPKKTINGSDIELLNKYVVSKTGFPIKYVIKKYEDENIYHDLIEKRGKLIISEEDDLIDEEGDMCADEMKYQLMKEEFDKQFVKIDDEDLYFKLSDRDRISSKSARQMKDAYVSKSYGFHLKKIGKNEWIEDKSKPKSFIERWIRDDDKKSASGYGVYPPPTSVPEGHINLWSKFPYQDLETEYTKKENEMKIILNLMKVLCNNCEIQYEHLLKWLAHMFQYPADKIGKFPIFIGDEGIGKGTFNKILRKLVGKIKYLETSQPENQVWGKFNHLMGDAYIVIINEFGKGNAKDAEGRIKNIITDETMNIKGEGDKPYSIESVHRFIGGTNNEDPIKSKKGDRRNWIIRCSDELKGNMTHFVELNAIIDCDDCMRTFYDYLMTIECADIRLSPTPLTEYQKIIQDSNVDIIELYIKNMTETYYKKGYYSDNNDDECEEEEDGETDGDDITADGSNILKGYTSEELFNTFRMFKTQQHINNYECSKIALMRRLKLWAYNNKLIETKKTKTCNMSVFNFNGLVKHFKLEPECLIKF